ncbi:MAG: SDR family oxidoreductase [Candidatus Hydrogenedentota bacterium]
MSLEDQVVMITGAGRGIGRGLAEAFANAGAHIVAVARSIPQINETAEAVRAMGRRAVALPCDVTDADAIKGVVETAEKDLGPIDILINNAGYAHFQPVAGLPREEWRRTLEVNLTGPFLCIQAVLPSMIERQRGRIINISSMAGVKPYPGQSAYCASKHGLNGLTKVLAMEMREYNIGVHSICPGGLDTELTRKAMPDRDKSDWMTPDDVAHAALYLATLSPRAATDEILLRRFDSPPLGG